MATEKVLLILMPWTPTASQIELLSQAVPDMRIETYVQHYSATEMPKSIPQSTWQNVTVLFTWKTFPTRIEAPKLEYVQLLSAGANHILELPLFVDTDIAFCTASGVHPPQMAEWVFTTFLAFQHHLPRYLDYQHEGKWLSPESDMDTEDAVGLTVGILGYGNIGRQIGRVAKAFGMNVHAYTLHERATAESRRDDSFTEQGLGDPAGEFPDRWYYDKDQLAEFLSSGLDLFVITVPSTPATKGMISTAQFDLLSKKKAYVSNVGRGSVVDTEALMVALDNKLIRGAALDVIDPEPLPDNHKLFGYENVIITPHVSGNSEQYNDRTIKILKYNLERQAEGKPLVNRVRKHLGY